jgi:hypothetical protein
MQVWLDAAQISSVPLAPSLQVASMLHVVPRGARLAASHVPGSVVWSQICTLGQSEIAWHPVSQSPVAVEQTSSSPDIPPLHVVSRLHAVPRAAAPGEPASSPGGPELELLPPASGGELGVTPPPASGGELGVTPPSPPLTTPQIPAEGLKLPEQQSMPLPRVDTKPSPMQQSITPCGVDEQAASGSQHAPPWMQDAPLGSHAPWPWPWPEAPESGDDVVSAAQFLHEPKDVPSLEHCFHPR